MICLQTLHGILATWNNRFCQSLSVLGVTVVMKTEVHTVEPIVSEANCL